MVLAVLDAQLYTNVQSNSWSSTSQRPMYAGLFPTPLRLANCQTLVGTHLNQRRTK